MTETQTVVMHKDANELLRSAHTDRQSRAQKMGQEGRTTGTAQQPLSPFAVSLFVVAFFTICVASMAKGNHSYAHSYSDCGLCPD